MFQFTLTVALTHPTDNQLVFIDNTVVTIDVFTISFNNTLGETRATNGHQITVLFSSDNNEEIMSATTADVLINGIPVTGIQDITENINGVNQVIGLNATLVINATQNHPEGAPPKLLITVTDAAGNDAVFTQTRLTEPNIIIDRDPPAYIEGSAFLVGPTSFNIRFDEPVYTQVDDGRYFPNLKVGGATVDRLNIITTGSGSSTLLVSWQDAFMTDSSLPTVIDTTTSLTFNATELITDLAGNPLSNIGIKTVPTATINQTVLDLTGHASTLLDDNNPIRIVTVRLGIDTVIQNITVPDNVYPVIDTLFGDNNENAVFPSHNITIASDIGTIEFPSDITVTGFASDSRTIQISPYRGAFDITDPNSNTTAFYNEYKSEYNLQRARIVEFGNPNNDLTFTESAITKITVPGLISDGIVFSVDTNGYAKRITACANNLNNTEQIQMFLDTLENSGGIDGALLVMKIHLADLNACYIDQNIWTQHFSGFGSAQSNSGGGGGGSGGCDECTAPTLGYNSRGQQLVSGGFSYNGNPSDVEYFFTPYPLIITEVGKENTAVFKIYDNQGPDQIMHFSMAFGLRTGDVISESKVMIEYDLDFQKNATITITDPENTIDNDSVRIETDTVQCMPDASYQCLQITIHHTFRSPLNFDIVASDVWDTKRNAWQNYYNHGVHITGESLDKLAGILVNNGTLRLYPLIADSTHVQVMVNEHHDLYRLAPDGNYHPLRNTYSLFHEIDESMYSSVEIPTQGIDRDDPRFAEYLFSQIELAQAVLNQIQLGQQIANDEFNDLLINGTSDKQQQQHPDHTRTQRIDDPQLQEAIRYEQSKAELLFKLLFNIRDDND